MKVISKRGWSARVFQDTKTPLPLRKAAPCALEICGGLQVLDFAAKIFLGHPEPFLQTAEKLVFLAFTESEIVVGKLAVFLFEFALHFVPVSFEIHRSHANVSGWFPITDVSGQTRALTRT